MTTDVHNGMDVVYSRDILERISELEEEMEEYQEENHLKDLNKKKPSKRWKEWEGLEEYCQLKDVEEQCDGYGDWKYGETLIRDDYFKEYAKELAEGLGYLPRDLHWPFTCIDWDEAADELKQDYTEIDWDGVTYWMRS